MSSIIIKPESPRHPAVVELIQERDRFSKSLYPAESQFHFDVSTLDQPHITFLVAESDATYVGCGAVARYDNYAEIKSMYVRPAYRGQRIAEQILAQLESVMLANEIRVVRLETGVNSDSALRLYERLGYVRRSPFGDYPDDPLCIFMEKQLDS